MRRFGQARRVEFYPLFHSLEGEYYSIIKIKFFTKKPHLRAAVAFRFLFACRGKRRKEKRTARLVPCQFAPSEFFSFSLSLRELLRCKGRVTVNTVPLFSTPRQVISPP